MAAFEYEALDNAGKPRRGVLSADSARMARRELRRQELLPISVTATAEPTAGANEQRRSLLPQRIGTRRLSVLTRQLATLIDAAAPVEQALHTVAMQADHAPSKRILLAVRDAVTEGTTLAHALARFPGSFGPVYRAMVATGEAAGNLGVVLERLADQLERGEALQRKVQGALIYPAVLALTAIGVVAALMAFVVPRLVEQFDTMGRELPWLTQTVIALSDFIRFYGLYVLLLILGLAMVLPVLMRRPQIRQAVDGALLRVPGLGTLLRRLYAARTTRTLGTLVGSGAPLVEALQAASSTVTNVAVQARLWEIANAVREGSALSAALGRAGLFQAIVTYMAASGEQSGRLPMMLGKAADYLEAEFNATIDTALALLEPAIILIMGGMVASIVLAILLPILRLNSMALL